jgi:elongation factor Tu
MASDTASSPRLPTVAVVTIGHYRHGKTTLTAAITKVLAARAGAVPIHVQDLDRRGGPATYFNSEAPHVTRTVVPGFVRYATEHRSFIHTDCPGHRPWLKNAARAQALADAVILVISAPDSVQPQTHEHLLLARALGIQQVVVFITRCDQVQDLEWVDLVERDTRDLLDRVGYDGNGTRILRGAALPVLTDLASPWASSIRDLIDALEVDLTVPAHDTAGPPLIYVHRALDRPQLPRDVIIEGRMRRGVINRQDRLVLLGYGDSVHIRVEDIEVAHHKVDSTEAGERVGLQLHSIDRALTASALYAGQALVPRDLAHARKDFRARIELYPLSEGGRTTGIRGGHISLFLFGTAVVAGRIHPPKDVIVQPGQSAEVTISLVHPIYMESGMPFMIRDGNQGAGWKRGVPAKWSGSCGNGTVVTTISP